jgi:hypothetical protein
MHYAAIGGHIEAIKYLGSIEFEYDKKDKV